MQGKPFPKLPIKLLTDISVGGALHVIAVKVGPAGTGAVLCCDVI